MHIKQTTEGTFISTIFIYNPLYSPPYTCICSFDMIDYRNTAICVHNDKTVLHVRFKGGDRSKNFGRLNFEILAG